MTFAETLNTKIASIVNGGFLDPLWDSDIRRMALEIDPAATILPFEDAGEPFFRVSFADRSEAVFDICGN